MNHCPLTIQIQSWPSVLQSSRQRKLFKSLSGSLSETLLSMSDLFPQWLPAWMWPQLGCIESLVCLSETAQSRMNGMEERENTAWIKTANGQRFVSDNRKYIFIIKNWFISTTIEGLGYVGRGGGGEQADNRSNRTLCLADQFPV